MDHSRRREPATSQAFSGGSDQVPGLSFQVGDIVRLTRDIPFSTFKAGDIVTIESLKDRMVHSPPPAGYVLGPAVPVAPNDSNTDYGVVRTEPISVPTYYRSRDHGAGGAPHHRELSVVAGGSPSGYRLAMSSKAFLKKDVVVYAGPDHNTAHHLTAPIGTRVFVVDSTTQYEAAAYTRGNKSTLHVGANYIVQAKVLHYHWQNEVCPRRASSDHFMKLPEADASSYKSRQLPPPAAASVQDDDIYETPPSWRKTRD